jgi:hypothetical protein
VAVVVVRSEGGNSLSRCYLRNYTLSTTGAPRWSRRSEESPIGNMIVQNKYYTTELVRSEKERLRRRNQEGRMRGSGSAKCAETLRSRPKTFAKRRDEEGCWDASGDERVIRRGARRAGARRGAFRGGKMGWYA